MRGALALLVVISPALAHDPITTRLVWTREISRLVYSHCASCHRPDGAAMSLMTYEDARPWAKAIRDEVLARRMPPWGAVKGIGEFRDDPSLSQIEIDMVVNWVEGGAPQGDDVYLPSTPQFKAPAGSPPVGRKVMVTTGASLTLAAPAQLAVIRPVRLAAGESLEVTAFQPDGKVQRLIWIRNWRPEWERTYCFLIAVRLPGGTRIAAYSGKPAAAALTLRQ